VQGPRPFDGPVTGIKLYKLVDGAWQHISENANPNVYDANEDKSTGKKTGKSGKKKKPDWHLAIDIADINTRADASLDYLADLGQQRVAFQLPDASW
jgi:hypothetical protein